jgi:tetratricopeptide (TPR) repeat protein
VLIPQHAFARFDDGDVHINIETTAGGRAISDADYQLAHGYLAADTRELAHGESLRDRQFAAVLLRYAAQHLYQTSRPEEALQLLEEARGHWEDNPELELQRLGILYEGLGQHAEALAGFRALLERTHSPEVRTRALLGLVHDLQSRSHHEEALGLLRTAYVAAPRSWLPAVLSSMSASYRTLRRFPEALITAELAAIQDGEAEDFTNLAILYKNADRLEDAIRCLRVSLEKNPESWNTRLILAGYLIRAGHEEEGWEMFGTVEAPRVDQVHHETNLAWFYGSVGRKAEFLEHLGEALTLSRSPRILNYIATEVDFDRYREDPEFQALVERHRARLLGEE